MSTRSTIACKMSDGLYLSIYCHFDGYLSGVGSTLLKYYNSQDAAESVVSIGDLSQLDKSMGCPIGHSYNTPKDGYSVAYGRDRGEKDTGAKIYATMDARRENRQEYNYTWTGEGWIVSGYGMTDVPLAEAIEADSDG